MAAAVAAAAVADVAAASSFQLSYASTAYCQAGGFVLEVDD